MTDKKAAFEIPSTPCKLMHVNMRTEKHGDSDVPCVDLKFAGIVFTKEQLIEFTGDKHAWNLMFEQKKGAAVEPTQPYFDPERYYPGKFEGCVAEIRFGLQTDTNELEDVKIKDIHFTALVGGNTAMRCTVQHELDDTEICADFAEYMGREVHIGIVFGEKADPNAKKQGNLPLGEKGAAPSAEQQPASTH